MPYPDLISMELYESNVTNANISVSCVVSQNSISIVVNPTNAVNVVGGYFPVLDQFGNQILSIHVNQEGVPVSVIGEQLSNDGKTLLKDLLNDVSTCMYMSRIMELMYTGEISTGEFTAPLSSRNNYLEDCYRLTYNAIRRINQYIKLAEQQLPDGPLYAPLCVLRSILYYNMSVMWGQVAYIDETQDELSYGELCRTPETLFDCLIPVLNHACSVMPDKVNTNYCPSSADNVVASSNDITDCIFLSKDVAHAILAKIYMYLNDYNEAKVHLLSIVDNGHYALHEEGVVMTKPEYILSLCSNWEQLTGNVNPHCSH